MNRSYRRMPASRILATATVALFAAGVGTPLARGDVGSEPVVEPQAVVDAALAAVATVPVPPSAPAEPEESADAPTAAAPAPVALPAAAPVPAGPSSEAQLSPASAPEPDPVPESQPELASDAVSAPAAPPPVPPEAPAAPPESPAAQAGSAAGVGTADTTQTRPISTPAPAPDPVAAVQQSPVNVNVSIRIESPGDGGSVTQVNAVIVTGGGDDGSGEGPTDANTSSSGDIDRDTENDPQESSADPEPDRSCEPSAGCCASIVLVSACLRADLSRIELDDIAEMLDSIFANAMRNPHSSAQIPSRAVQIGPVNLNISIRIQSPGNDGSVVQTNLVRVRTAISVAVAAAVPLPLGVDSAAQPALVAEPEQASSDSGSEQPPDPTVVFEEPSVVALPVGVPPFGSARLLPVRIALTIAPISLGGIVISPSLGLRRSPLEAATPSPAAAGDGPTSLRGEQSREGHRVHRPPAPAPEPPVTPPIEASFAPAPPAVGGGGGGIPLALTIPFALGLLDVGFRRLRAWRATPSAVGGRRPERPG